MARWLTLLLLLGCGDDSMAPDAGAIDAGSDVGTSDVGVEDSSMPDAPMVDAPSPDVSVDAPPACTVAASSETRMISFGGAEREYVLHVGDGAGASNALVFDLHGFTETPDRQNGRSGMRAKADAEGFILVQPRGQGASWNAGACCGSASGDDVGLLRAIGSAAARPLAEAYRRRSLREKLGLSLDDACEKAWRIEMETNPFPSVMGRVCPHPCETGCNRGQKEQKSLMKLQCRI